ncbi:Zonadhesin [Liparis tanakae]|uniref:Zonadhesin n=1 Tax=Liparis tanakae TaxID=230148 RepID=A0A4Z2EXL9_9TELE|nr:Zonadhesin [Liparis tanakae]
MREQPAAMREQLSATREHPVVTREQPSATREHPVVTREQPSATREHPVVTREQPSATREHPVVTREQPSATREHPVVTREPGQRKHGRVGEEVRELRTGRRRKVEGRTDGTAWRPSGCSVTAPGRGRQISTSRDVGVPADQDDQRRCGHVGAWQNAFVSGSGPAVSIQREQRPQLPAGGSSLTSTMLTCPVVKVVSDLHRAHLSGCEGRL